MLNHLNLPEIKTKAGILVVDSSRKIVSLNRKFIEMWSLPQAVIVSKDDQMALELAAKLVEDQKSFINSVKEIYMYGQLDVYDTIQLKNNRIFKRHSSPQLFGEKIVGRIWFFYD